MACISIVSGPPTSWRSRPLRLRASALRERLEAGHWTIAHLPGQWLPADLLTKALGVAKCQSLLPLRGMSSGRPPPLVNRVSVGVEPRKRLLLMGLSLLLVVIVQLLMGQDVGPGTEDTETSLNVWLLSLVISVILCWEGLRAASSAALRCIRVIPRARTTNHHPSGHGCSNGLRAPLFRPFWRPFLRQRGNDGTGVQDAQISELRLRAGIFPAEDVPRAVSSLNLRRSLNQYLCIILLHHPFADVIRWVITV